MPKRKERGAATVTILDVARHAGVSPMTVSRVINGHSYVGEEMRQRVEASVKALRYTPNLAGRSLRSSGSARIGVLYSNPSAAYLNQFMLGVLEQGSQSGSQLLIEKCSGIRSQRAATERLLAAGVDGVILPPPLCDSRSAVEELESAGVPVVAVATGSPMDGVASVRIDDYQGARAMTRYLLELGHRDIGFIKGDPQHTPAALRAAAFFDTMKEAGLAVPPGRIAQGLFTYRSGLAAAEQLLKAPNRPTAIFSSNDDMAAAVVSVAHGLGLHVPEELTVTGFDDTPVATTVWPELTTIHQPVAAMARAAMVLIQDEIRRKRSGRPKAATHQVMKFTLVKRQSSASPATSA
ncbi:LacI family DNA-binding transcriptional regulator [Lysobacter cavernae]|uniref:LacI family DNA-binding transcriptional regulator n=1 Tax=Lysobacter cavernae TaxID=1685901 RepID=A0ABV7RVL9_9GAMM